MNVVVNELKHAKLYGVNVCECGEQIHFHNPVVKVVVKILTIVKTTTFKKNNGFCEVLLATVNSFLFLNQKQVCVFFCIDAFDFFIGEFTGGIQRCEIIL